ncbi:MAG: redoxin family protein [Gemmataceae bacterium]
MQSFTQLRRTYIAVTAASCLAAGCGQDDSARSSLKKTDTVSRTPLHVVDLEGRSFDIWKSASTTVVVFTRTDCPISNRSAPEIRRLYERYHSQGVEFFLIYVDPSESVDAIRKHLQEFHYPCPALRDPRHALVTHCQATTTPEAVVFNAKREITYQGRIDDLYADVGRPRSEPTTHDLADAIESTVHGQPVAHPRTQATGCIIADLKD